MTSFWHAVMSSVKDSEQISVSNYIYKLPKPFSWSTNNSIGPFLFDTLNIILIFGHNFFKLKFKIGKQVDFTSQESPLREYHSLQISHAGGRCSIFPMIPWSKSVTDKRMVGQNNKLNKAWTEHLGLCEQSVMTGRQAYRLIVYSLLLGDSDARLVLNAAGLNQPMTHLRHHRKPNYKSDELNNT